jgi:hypothetical protein
MFECHDTNKLYFRSWPQACWLLLLVALRLNILILWCAYISMNIHRIPLQSKEILSHRNWKNLISKLTEECSNESDINKKTYLFYKINSVLPKSYRVNIPSLITDDYIDTALYRIYQNIQAGSTAAV